MTVKHAAHIRELDEMRQLARERRLDLAESFAQLGGNGGRDCG